MSNKKLDRLQKLKETFNGAINREIEKEMIQETVSKLNDMSVYRCIDIFNTVLPELMEEAEGNNIIKAFAKTVKMSKPLKKAFSVNRMVKEGKNINNKSTFASICSDQLSDINSNLLKKDSKKLTDVVKKAVTESGLPHEQIEAAINDTDTPLNEALDYLTNNKCSNSNMIIWSNNVNVLKENMSDKHDTETIAENVTVKSVMNELEAMVNDTNRPKWERDTLFEIASTMVSDGNMSELFESHKKACISNLEKAMEKTTLEEKTRLNEMKTKIESKNYNPASIFEDLLNMSELSSIIMNS